MTKREQLEARISNEIRGIIKPQEERASCLMEWTSRYIERQLVERGWPEDVIRDVLDRDFPEIPTSKTADCIFFGERIGVHNIEIDLLSILSNLTPLNEIT